MVHFHLSGAAAVPENFIFLADSASVEVKALTFTTGPTMATAAVQLIPAMSIPRTASGPLRCVSPSHLKYL